MAEKKGGLGRGIGALIPTSPVPSERPAGSGSGATGGSSERPIDVFFNESGNQSQNLVAVPGARFGYLDINAIVPNSKQPRSVFEPEAFAELVHSVREFGVLQPIVVRPLAKKSGKAQFELIMGERRFRATKEAGLSSIPAIIRDTANEHMLRDALLENLHRAELNPLEEASAYQQLLEDFGITQDELADRMGRSRPQITNTIRLLKLPTSIQLKVASGVLSAGHARAILGAAAPRREYWADRVINEGLSVRTLEERLSLEKTLEETGSTAAKSVAPAPRLEVLDEMAAKLSDKISTRVKIKMTNKKGQILIEFANLNDLKRILNELDPA